MMKERVFCVGFARLALACTILACAGTAPAGPPPVVTVQTNESGFIAVAPDGSVVATAADPVPVVNAAIARVAQSGGGSVMLAAGTYTISAPIEVKTGVRLVGAGGLLTDPRPADHYPAVLRAGKAGLLAVVNLCEARGARLEHLELDGAGLAENCVKAAGYAIRIRDCVIKNGAERGVWVTAGQDSQHDTYVQAILINCLIDQGGRGIGVDVSSDPALKSRGFTDGMIFKCRIRNAGETGVTLAGGWQFLDNRVSCAARLGSVHITGGYTMVTDNEIESTGLGPAIRVAASNTTITGNRLRCAGGGSAVELAGGNRVVTLTGNECVRSGKPGKCFVESTGGPQAAVAVFDNSTDGCSGVCNLATLPASWYCERNTPANHPQASRPPEDGSPRSQNLSATVFLSEGKCMAEDAEGRTLASDADAATVINAAIAKAATRGPGAVLIRSGTYTLRSPIALKPGVRLAGEGGMNSAGTGFQPHGTVLQAAPSCKIAVVDMTEAADARLEQLAVDGNGIAASCVKMAGRNARICDCFIGRAEEQAVWVTHGNDPAPEAYSGMTLADTLIHAGHNATCLVVRKDPLAKGAAPANGAVINSRLKMGRFQAVFAGGPGWSYLGNHATSGNGSVFGVEVRSDAMRLAGNYFDTVAAGARLRLAGRNLLLEGNHFQKSPGAFPTILVETASTDLSILANTWNSRPGADNGKSFIHFLGQPPANTSVIGNVGRGGGTITNLTQAGGAFRCEGNWLHP
jgi:hypothetical protein